MTSSPTASQSSWSVVEAEDARSIASSSTSTLDPPSQSPIEPPALLGIDENNILRSRISDLERNNAILEDQLREHRYITWNQSDEIVELREKINELEDDKKYIAAGFDPGQKENQREIAKMKIRIGQEGDKARNEMLAAYQKHLKSLGDDVQPTKKDLAESNVILSNQAKRIEELVDQLKEATEQIHHKETLIDELTYIAQSLETEHAKLSHELKEMGMDQKKLDGYKTSIVNVKKRYKRRLAQREKGLKVDSKTNKANVVQEDDKADSGLGDPSKEADDKVQSLKKENDESIQFVDQVKLENEQITGNGAGIADGRREDLN
ncbi:uncharacterized protein I303_105794 [Kwoniella dejecticola CBS 10117]|uniref:Uncharacterized protein n=1 Tax=Kwoniella dejecticola CBS 10117 TaxID=1296121 RepID=A0A1A6A0G9_9TREE|nr:uncharacterized protein I303_05816 [Kwoniella dejecticola CBS 10117]OBR83536.1 hypothetical protein I303_05816 [Kwoniella dejecticola CBS 10117]